MSTTNNRAIVPMSFDAAVGNGATTEQARDMHRKHANKIYSDAMVRELELELEQLKQELHNSRLWKKFKSAQRELKLARRRAEQMDDVYMGAVSTGLAGFLPGASITEKLYQIKRATESELELLTNGGDNGND